MTFRITGLARADFAHLFEMDDAELIRRDARRVFADRERAFPCRVSLVDAEVGEELILVHHEHLAVRSPFRSSHAVYVRRAAEDARLEPGEIPDLLRARMLSLRGFDGDAMMHAAELVEGREFESAIEVMLADRAIDYIHIHYAKPGCFAARVDRALIRGGQTGVGS
jgi:hypothetical protein